MVHRNIRRDHRHKSYTLYSTDASHDFNLRLHRILHDLGRDLANSLGDHLIAVVVGGSYGRGDARFLPSSKSYGTGVWSVGQAPIDEIELILITKGRYKLNLHKTQSVLNKYSLIIGVPVVISLSLAQNALYKAELTLQWYDLVRSHFVVYGPEKVLNPEYMVKDKDIFSLHYSWGDFALESITQRSNSFSYLTFLQGLADVVCVSAKLWELNASLRISRAQDIISKEPWFSAHSSYTELLVNAFSDAEKKATRLSRSLVSELQDCVELWVFILDYLSYTTHSRHRWIYYLRNLFLYKRIKRKLIGFKRYVELRQ